MSDGSELPKGASFIKKEAIEVKFVQQTISSLKKEAIQVKIVQQKQRLLLNVHQLYLMHAI